MNWPLIFLVGSLLIGAAGLTGAIALFMSNADQEDEEDVFHEEQPDSYHNDYGK